MKTILEQIVCRAAITALVGLWTTRTEALPSIKTSPQPQRVICGSNVVLSVTATGREPLRYRWRFGGTDLHSGGAIVGADGPKLKLKDFRSYQAGDYDVVVSDRDGEVISQPAKLAMAALHWPGYPPHKQVESFYVRDGIAFVSSVRGYDGLSILDVSSPTDPRQIGHWPDNDWAGDISAVGSHVYVRLGHDVKILDVSKPFNPVEVGLLSSFIATKPYKDYLCAVNGTNFVVWDRHNPTNLVRVGETPLSADTILIDGDFAYTLDTKNANSPMSIVDLRDPARPRIASWYDLKGWIGGMAKRGNYLLVATDQSDLLILDVSSPRSPKFVSSYDLPSYPTDVTVYGHYALVACYWWGLSIIDISDPSAPNEVAFYDTHTELRSADGMIHKVAVEGQHAYMFTDYGIQILDLEDPSHPRLVGGDLRAVDVAVSTDESTAYVLDELSGLHAVDIKNPSHPRRLGSYDVVSYARSVVIRDNLAYIIEGDFRESVVLSILDVSDGSNLRRIGDLVLDSSGSPLNLALNFDLTVTNGVAYIGAGLTGLWVVDVTRPNAPRLLSHLGQTALGVQVKADRAYFVSGTGSKAFQIADLSNLGDLQVLGTWDSSASDVSRLVLSGDYAWLADSKTGLQVIDLTNATEPYRIAQFDGKPNDIIVEKDRAFVSDRGLRLLDVRDPLSIRAVSAIPLAGAGHALALTAGNVLVADGSWGLGIVSREELSGLPRLSTPQNVGGKWRAQVVGGTGLSCVVEMTDSLVKPRWEPVTTNVSPFELSVPFLPLKNGFFRVAP